MEQITIDIEDSQVRLVKGEGGLDKIVVDNVFAYCEIYCHGAHVTEYKVKQHGDSSLLWLSQGANFQQGKAIRGGIPICWPWFGAAPSYLADVDRLPAHGFARNNLWQFVKAVKTLEGESHVQFELKANDHTKALWPFDFHLIYDVYVGKQLRVELTTLNTDVKTFLLSEALHSYFSVKHIDDTVISGLGAGDYVDKVLSSVQQQDVVVKASDSLTISQEVDRVYLNSTGGCKIAQGAANHMIVVEKSGSCDTVVWNPWQDKALSMGDFDDEGYHHMLCIEAANTSFHPVEVAPNERHTISQTISIE